MLTLLVRLTRSKGNDLGPSWSPDGRRIAFASSRDGDSEIYVMNADGTGELNLTNNVSLDKNPSWSPNGGKIAFASDRDGDLEIYLMNVDGTEQENLTRSPGAEDDLPTWSPNSEGIAYASKGRPRSSQEGLGVVSVALQAALLMGFVLLAMRRRIVPPGAITILFTVNALLMTMQESTYFLIPGAVAAGLAADGLLWVAKSSDHRSRSIRLLSFFVPAIYYAFYFLAISVSSGIGWPLELWSGSVVLAGSVGLLLSYLVMPHDYSRLADI